MCGANARINFRKKGDKRLLLLLKDKSCSVCENYLAERYGCGLRTCPNTRLLIMRVYVSFLYRLYGGKSYLKNQ